MSKSNGANGAANRASALYPMCGHIARRGGAPPTTVKAPVKRQMTLGFAVAPKKPRVE